MIHNHPLLQRRKNIRLKGYDYSLAGAYFITLVTWQRACLFGEVVGEEMQVNELGKVVREEWFRSAEIRREIELDEFVIMPNHFHGIVFINDVSVGATGRSPLPKPAVPNGPKPASLGSLIAGFKSAGTTHINRIRQTSGTPVWQRNYYDHIIRNDRELDNIRLYIQNNPRLWAEDTENPSHPV